MQKIQVQFLCWEDPLEEEMATHSRILAWRVPWTEEPGGLQSRGSWGVGHNWSAWAHSRHIVNTLLNCFQVTTKKGRNKIEKKRVRKRQKGQKHKRSRTNKKHVDVMLEVSSDVSTTTISEDRLDSRIKRQRLSDKTGKQNHYMLFNKNVNLRQDNTVSLRVKWW